MQLTKILIAVGLLASSGLATPLEARGDEKQCQWVCDHYKPQCDDKYKPMYCSKWGDQKSCSDYKEGCDHSKTYCCKYGKCWGS